MPLLKPAGERLASSWIVSWARSLVHTIQSHASKPLPGQSGLGKAASLEGKYSESDGVDGRNSKSSKDTASEEGGIYANHQVHQHSCLSNDSLEMAN